MMAGGGLPGDDADKQINDRKCQLTVVAEGVPIVVRMHSTDVQNQVAATDVMATFLRKFAEGGCGSTRPHDVLIR